MCSWLWQTENMNMNYVTYSLGISSYYWIYQWEGKMGGKVHCSLHTTTSTHSYWFSSSPYVHDLHHVLTFYSSVACVDGWKMFGLNVLMSLPSSISQSIMQNQLDLTAC